jgi:broad specificity phosphatase PhoE
MNAMMIDSFYFFQIGNTEWTSCELVVGQKDIPLSEEGRHQAQESAKVLAGHPFASLCHGTLGRAKETAHIIAEQCPCRLFPLDSLNDRCWGEWESKSIPLEQLMNSEDHLPHGAESHSAFKERVLRGIEQSASYPAPVLFVSDDWVLRILCEEMGLDFMTIPGQATHMFKQLGRWTHKALSL